MKNIQLISFQMLRNYLYNKYLPLLRCCGVHSIVHELNSICIDHLNYVRKVYKYILTEVMVSIIFSTDVIFILSRYYLSYLKKFL